MFEEFTSLGSSRSTYGFVWKMLFIMLQSRGKLANARNHDLQTLRNRKRSSSVQRNLINSYIIFGWFLFLYCALNVNIIGISVLLFGFASEAGKLV